MRHLLAALLPCIGIFVLAGCGGGGAQPPTGRATFTVHWPAPSRLIPAASDSIQVQIQNGTNVVASQILARPAAGGNATATFDPLPVGALTATASAYPNIDGSGVAQAQASVPLTIQAGQSTAFSITMASTIDHLQVSPPGPSVLAGQNAQLTVTAVDAAGDVVLTAPSNVHWQSADTAHATVDDTGKVSGVLPTGLAPGPVKLTVTEAESGKSATVSLAVTSNTTVSVAPSPATLSVGDPQTFTATVTNTSNTAVTWSIQEGAAGGVITPAGNYTAPAIPGTFHVEATSQFDNSKQATVIVSVQAGNANVTIQ